MSDKNIAVWKNYDATGRDLHVDVPLSNAIMNYTTQGLVGEFMFPVVPVDKQSNMIKYFPLGEFLRSESLERAPGTEANQLKFSVSSMGYFCKNYAAKYPITLEDRENADAIWAVREAGALLIVDAIRIAKEVRVFNTVNSTSNVSTAFKPASAWNGATSPGDPYTQILAVQNQVQDKTGFVPNRIVFGNAAWRTFVVSSPVRGLLFPHGGGVATLAQASALFNAECRIAEGYYNSAGENLTATLTSFFSDRVWVGYTPPGQGRIGPRPQYSATLRWTLPAIPNMAVESLPFDRAKKAEFVEVGVYDDEKVLDTSLGATLIGVNSAQSGGITG
jgi:hypothetical protein